MSVGVRGECARARGGGLRALVAWLRRDDSASSSESLSSAGSDRTAASFAFLAPRDRPPHAPAALAPPTDSYRKRVHDCNQRRQYDRNLTLHRKYGLYYGYDAFSLPPARKNLDGTTDEQDRGKRANSESLPRRVAHVPGKRRAPPPPHPPPSRPLSVASAASLTRRHNRKRPAPQPPVFTRKTKENIQAFAYEKIYTVEMNSNPHHERRPLSDVAPDETRSEKHSKKENVSKNTKIRSEKNFLKQIFDSRKRNSAIETAPERILPSISELDKQAAEIIKSCKLTPLGQNYNGTDVSTSQEAWFCTRCLRRYDSTVVTCQYCLPEQKRLSGIITDSKIKNVSSSVIKGNSSTQTESKGATDITSSNRISAIGADEKQKLKEMLKEMKDSLPKKSKGSNNEEFVNKSVFKFDSSARSSTSLETPTLRIESKVCKEDETISNPQPSTSKEPSEASNCSLKEMRKIEKILPAIKTDPVSQNVVITQHVVLVAPQTKDGSKLDNNNSCLTSINTNTVDTSEGNKPLNVVTNFNLNTPLKISSLLNPVYIPKSNPLEAQSPRCLFFSQNKEIPNETSKENSAKQLTPTKPLNTLVTASTSALKTDEASTPSVKVKNAAVMVDEKPMIEAKNNLGNTEQHLPNKLENEKITKRLLQPVPVSTCTSINPAIPTTSTSASVKSKILQSNMVKFTVDQHFRRRELVNQLEQSIAKGDERAAADAAVKLAQLRLSCSVLSYSSQIMSETSGVAPSSTKENQSPVVKSEEKTAIPTPINKVDAAAQSSATYSINKQMKSKVDLGKDVLLQPEKQMTSKLQEVKTLDENIDIKQKELNKPSSSASKQTSNQNDDNFAMIQVWVEDREATRGPVRLRISRHATMGDLRRQAETSLGLVSALQRWIVGRALCADDRIPIVSLAGPDLSAPFYLCVVETETIGATHSKIADTSIKTSTQTNADKTSDVYSELVKLEQRALIVSTEPFECGVCMQEYVSGDGAVLRECVHTFCRDCLSDLIKYCEEPIVTCPAMGCTGILQEREIRALVTKEEYERWLARGLAAAENGTRNAFHCRTRDCTGWALCDPQVRKFPCPVCKHTNCISCQAIHEGQSCEEYHKKLQEAATTSTSSQSDEGTRALLDALIAKGEALECPECSAVITKKWGCDWVKCSACKTEICWVTRGRRWGPGGKGDTTGGCRCGVDGKKCHPSCGYCH